MGYSQNSLISSIYDMALGRTGWDTILDIFGASLPGSLVLLSGDDLAARQNLVFAHRGLTGPAAAAYADTFAGLNPLLDAVAALGQQQVYHDDQLLARDAATATRFWRDWLAPQGDYRAATGLVLLREGTRQLTLDIRYRPGDAETRQRAGHLLGEAAPHFARAFEIDARSRFAAGGGYLDHVVEDLPFSIFFVDRQMRIHYANGAAQAMRRQPDGPFAAGDGTLRAVRPEADRSLRQIVQRMLTARRSSSPVIRLDGATPDDRYFAIARLAQRDGQRDQLHDAVTEGGPLVMLVVHGGIEVAALPLELLWHGFSLTEAEARLAEALLAGATLADIAKARAVSKQTLRNQLVGVMRKTGTRRQAELVSLLTRLSLACL